MSRYYYEPVDGSKENSSFSKLSEFLDYIVVRDNDSHYSIKDRISIYFGGFDRNHNCYYFKVTKKMYSSEELIGILYERE